MPTTLNILPAIAERLARYAAADIPTIVYEQDDMFKPGGMDRYLAVGRSAIDVIARAMLTAGRTEIKSVLALPSGAGRGTRHLRVFFPEAELFVCDIVTEKAAFAAKHFGATCLEPVPLFATPSKRKFDLIFVGSRL